MTMLYNAVQIYGAILNNTVEETLTKSSRLLELKRAKRTPKQKGILNLTLKFSVSFFPFKTENPKYLKIFSVTHLKMLSLGK